ncbi:MAG TPA: hypothetical protein VES20_25370 [Bryobacteraceae bacterium]|nr:hypothetical protein [Bryobacteraceae bacterium]
MLAAAAATVIFASQISATLDVRLSVLGSRGERPWWSPGTSLELTLHDRHRPERWYRLATLPGETDCSVRVERATDAELVLTCMPEKGRASLRHKFLYDARAKALIKHFDFDEADEHALLAEPRRDPPFRIAPPSQPRANRRPPFQLPQSSYDAFAKARPKRVKDGYTRESSTIREEVGPTQREGERLWFARSFCDGEGTTGVGGFGYRDKRTGKLHLWSPPEIADWSASALLVAPDAVWIGLVHFGEWGATGGGLLRFDRQSELVSITEVPDIVGSIRRDGDRMLLETEFGGAIVEGPNVRRFFVDRTSTGRARVTEALVRPGPWPN